VPRPFAIDNIPSSGTNGAYGINSTPDTIEALYSPVHTPSTSDVPGEPEVLDDPRSIEESPLPSPDVTAFENKIFSVQADSAPVTEFYQWKWNSKENGPLGMDAPAIQSYIEILQEKGNPQLIPLIEWILGSDWYRNGAAEQLPPMNTNLRGLIKPRSTLGANKSPFSAFISDKFGRSSYECLLCSDKQKITKRSLIRAVGHARWHFHFKIDGYYDENTRKDQEKRKTKSRKHCTVWSV
jgi:hypothetical protein